MPAVSAAKVPCIAQLASELGFASKPTLLRHLERIDELGPQIDPDGIYPQDWIVFRITGYRPEIDSPALVPGDALRGDLSAVAEHISEHAHLSKVDIAEPYETIDSLADRWSVSRKTIERYRRLGLIARRLDLGGGRRSVIFMRSAVEWFEALNGERLGRAARFDRIPDAQLARFARWASRYHARLGWSRSQAAARIALRTGHSHEGVRKALLRIDQSRKAPLFSDPPPTTTRDQFFALRAALRGIEPSAIAKRTDRSHNATLRAINHARADLIESFNLPETTEQGDEIQSVLASPAVNQGLLTRGQTDLCVLIELMQKREPTVGYEIQMRTRAYHLLLQRAGSVFGSMNRATPSGPTLDAIETDLRLASMLKIELIRAQLHLIGSTIEHQIGGAIDTLDPARASFLLLGAIRVAGDAIDRFDPTHTGRIAAPVGLAVTRFASQQPDIAQPSSTGKATRRIPLGHMILDWTTQITAWDRWVMCDRRIESVLDQLNERDRLILVRRFGFDGCPPITRSELAGLLGTSSIHALRFERVALRNGLCLARGG
jgi:RNA polymerase primary sigma factor